MNARMDAVIQQLREEETLLQTQRSELEQQIKELEENVKRVRAALVALGEKPAGRAARKKASSTQAPSKDEIANVLAEILGSSGALETDSLRAEAEDRLRSKGQLRVSFTGRFQEALEDDRFIESPAGWKLVDETESESEFVPPEPSPFVG